MQIHLMDTATEQVTQLTFLTAGADQPSWHPDDGQIVFHSGPSIYMAAVAGGAPALIATGLDDFNAYEYPSLSRDGTEVLFSRRNEINARTLEGGVQRYVVQNWTVTEETPALSPDGVLVAYSVGCDLVEVIAVTPFSSYAPDPCATQLVTPPSAGSARRPAWASSDVLAFERSATSDRSLSSTVISGTTMPGAVPFDIVGPPGAHRAPNWAPVGFQPNELPQR